METALNNLAEDAPKPRTGIRQERARQRRHLLSQVVMQLIEERGFDAISVNEVAQRAAMSVGGLYRHIDTKSDLLEMVCDEINDNLIEDMIAAAGAARGVEDKLKAAIRTYWERHWDAAASILVAYREYQSLGEEAKRRYTAEERKIAEFLCDLIRAGVAIDVFRAVDDRLLAHEIILLAHMRALKGWVFEGRPREAVLAEHLDLIFSRLRPYPGASR
jgi:TetR/AcrR family transcriptional regulator, cholesterol catabolism regulator